MPALSQAGGAQRVAVQGWRGGIGKHWGTRTVGESLVFGDPEGPLQPRRPCPSGPCALSPARHRDCVFFAIASPASHVALAGSGAQ